MTMAVGVNRMPQEPSGPERDSSRYTTKPTTTEGSASKVFSTPTTKPWPGKRTTANQAPRASPMPAPSRQAVPLTCSDRPTTCARRGSAPRISDPAVARLSWKVLTGDRAGGGLRQAPERVLGGRILSTGGRLGDMFKTS